MPASPVSSVPLLVKPVNPKTTYIVEKGGRSSCFEAGRSNSKDIRSLVNWTLVRGLKMLSRLIFPSNALLDAFVTSIVVTGA
uniref:Uncharacterized protein n=1 Tax=Amphimedon queenslandica TaxID=400682 RepID=A0A1X7VL73_AMPQE